MARLKLELQLQAKAWLASLDTAHGNGNTGQNLSPVLCSSETARNASKATGDLKKKGKKEESESAADVYLQHNIRTRDMELKASYSSDFI